MPPRSPAGRCGKHDVTGMAQEERPAMMTVAGRHSLAGQQRNDLPLSCRQRASLAVRRRTADGRNGRGGREN
jgi:hypothetical protein